MSVMGFDLGNKGCIMAVDVVLNEESKRETPVCFGISHIKRLLGRKFSDPELQSDLASFPFRVTEGPDGVPLVHARYLGEERAFTPTQLLAMVLSSLKDIAERRLNAQVVDCCIGIPVYFTDVQRRAVLDAATIANLRPLLQCAILSPTFKVREFQVNDGFPFSIALSWNGDSQNAPQQTLVFPKGNAIPSTKALTFFKSSTFEVDVLYVDQDDSQIQQKISTYTVGPFQTSKGEKAKLKVEVRLDIHGIVTIDSATMLEEEDVEVPVSSANEAPNDTTKMDTDDAPSDPAAGSDVTMQEPQSDTTEAAPSCENRAQDSEGKSSQMETGAKVEPSKEKIKKTTVPVHELVYGALAAADLQKEKEYDLATAAAAARGANMGQCTQPPPQLKLPESKITELTDDENHVSQIKPVADIELSGLQPHRLLQTIEKSPGGGSQCSLHEEIPTDANAIADAAWEALKRSIGMLEGAALNNNQVLMRDFTPSVLAFLMKGEHFIVKKILVETAVLIVDPLKLGAKCKVHPRSPTQKAESLLTDFGEPEKHLDSALWWIFLLHAYTKRTGDNSLAKSFDCQRAMHLILSMCLSKDLNSYSIDTHNLFVMAMKCALSLLKQDSDADFVNRIKEKIQDLIYNLHSYHWLDLQMPIGTNTRTTLNKSNVPLESLPKWINLSRSRGGYFIGNASRTIMDFGWFCLGNFIAILSSVVTGEQAEAILNLVEENLEWLSGCDPKNTRWSYHNGGSWPVLSWPLVEVSVKLGRLHLARRAVELMEQQLANEGFPKYYDGKTGVADYLVARMLLDDPSHQEKYWNNMTDFEREEFLKWTKNDESNRLIEKKQSDDFDFGDIIHFCRRKASFLVNLELSSTGGYRVRRTHQRGSTMYRWHNDGRHSLGDFSRTTLRLFKGPDKNNLRPVDDSIVLYEFRETEGPKEKVLWKFELKDYNSKVSSVINTLEDEIKALKVESVEEEMQRRVKELEFENVEKDRLLKELELDNAEKDRLVKELKLENAEKDKCLRKLEIDYEHMKDQLGKKLELGELLRKKLHNQIMALKGHMRVFCRVRPLFSKEETVVTLPTPPTSLENAGREIKLIEKGKDVFYKFDKVFDSAASQEAIFKDIAELVQSALDGHKVTIFSYGQTGSGKTYTMIGKPNDEEEGMIPRAFKEIFRCIKSWEDNGWIYEVKASMLEIYCEKISDLLDNHKPCDIYDCEEEDVVLRIADKSKLEEKLICSAEEAYKLFELASKCRTVGKTHMNDVSSRSHFFFKLKINGYNKLSSEKVEGVLQMIDLAGSETCTGETSDTQKRESKDINRSLSALTRLFGEIGRDDVHLSYRDSKLTRLLQGYFTGDSKVLMFINIAPEFSCIGTTKNSLKVGCDVNNCKIKRKTQNHKQQQKSDEIEESHMTHYKSKRDVTKQATVTKPRARGVQFGTSIKSPAIGRIGSCSKIAPIGFG